MSELTQSRNLPSTNRLSVLTAMIMLAYGLNQFMDIPSRTLSLQLPGLFLAVEVNDNLLTALLVAGMAAAGADWMFRDHPALRSQLLLPHILIPAVTALVIGVPLNQMEIGVIWWIGLLVGTIILILVLVAEYIAIDIQDFRQPVAAVGLSAVAFTIFLILASAIKAVDTRLFLSLPILFIASGLASLRSLNLRLHGPWVVYEATIIALIVSQVAAAIHYWPLTPIRYGLILLGLAYALTGLFSGLIEEKPARELIAETGVVLGIAWLGALLLA